MTSNRYNSFNRVHKGLRALLFETALQLQQADLSKEHSGESAIQQIEEVLFLFEVHAKSEDHFFNEPLEKIDPESSELFLKEHEEDHRLALVISDLIGQWKKANQNEARLAVGKQLLYAFHEFVAFNLYHMNKEEIELNEVLWQHYSDEEIKATEQELVKNVPPPKMLQFAKWMVRGANDIELHKWIEEVSLNAPAPVFDMICKVANEQLTPDRYSNLIQSLKEAKTTAY